ncbi:hypothetical protein ACFL10_00390 [Patescibacteria group bacterium]
MTDESGSTVPITLIDNIESNPSEAKINKYDGLEVKFPFGQDIAAKALCVICNTGLPNQGVSLTLQNNVVKLSHLPKDPAELIQTVQASAQQVMGGDSGKPVQLDFKRISKKTL